MLNDREQIFHLRLEGLEDLPDPTTVSDADAERIRRAVTGIILAGTSTGGRWLVGGSVSGQWRASGGCVPSTWGSGDHRPAG